MFYLNDLNFMPIFELRHLDDEKHKFDIYREQDTRSSETDNKFLDAIVEVDYEKLRKYI